MKVKEMLEILSKVNPELDIITGANNHTASPNDNTYLTIQQYHFAFKESQQYLVINNVDFDYNNRNGYEPKMIEELTNAKQT